MQDPELAAIMQRRRASLEEGGASLLKMNSDQKEQGGADGIEEQKTAHDGNYNTFLSNQNTETTTTILQDRKLAAIMERRRASLEEGGVSVIVMNVDQKKPSVEEQNEQKTGEENDENYSYTSNKGKKVRHSLKSGGTGSMESVARTSNASRIEVSTVEMPSTEIDSSKPRPINANGNRSPKRFSANRTICPKCEKTVYPAEAIKFEKITYHKTCFKCSHCNGKLKISNVALVGGKLFCKPHFKELFSASGGKYSFGGNQTDDDILHGEDQQVSSDSNNRTINNDDRSSNVIEKSETQAAAVVAKPGAEEKEGATTTETKEGQKTEHTKEEDLVRNIFATDVQLTVPNVTEQIETEIPEVSPEGERKTAEQYIEEDNFIEKKEPPKNETPEEGITVPDTDVQMTMLDVMEQIETEIQEVAADGYQNALERHNEEPASVQKDRGLENDHVSEAAVVSMPDTDVQMAMLDVVEQIETEIPEISADGDVNAAKHHSNADTNGQKKEGPKEAMVKNEGTNATVFDADLRITMLDVTEQIETEIPEIAAVDAVEKQHSDKDKYFERKEDSRNHSSHEEGVISTMVDTEAQMTMLDVMEQIETEIPETAADRAFNNAKDHMGEHKNLAPAKMLKITEENHLLTSKRGTDFNISSPGERTHLPIKTKPTKSFMEDLLPSFVRWMLFLFVVSIGLRLAVEFYYGSKGLVGGPTVAMLLSEEKEQLVPYPGKKTIVSRVFNVLSDATVSGSVVKRHN